MMIEELIKKLQSYPEGYYIQIVKPEDDEQELYVYNSKWQHIDSFQINS